MILAKKAGKLKKHKECGRETWLVFYHTIWTVLSPFDRQRLFKANLNPDHDCIDYIGIVAGNLPDDAWLEVIR